MSLTPDSRSPKPVGGQSPPRPVPRFRETALASGVIDAGQIDACEQDVAKQLGAAGQADAVRWDAAVAECMVARQMLTPFQAEQLLAGRRKLTLGQYRILDELGRGGMGQVFRAQHVMMGRTVAVKVLPKAKSTSEAEAAFQREIRMLSRLDHDNLVRALDAGHDGKVYYMVTELVPGLDLRQQVLKYGKLDEIRAASVISQAALGLGYAHTQGLVHRDMKPANLLVTPDGVVKVLDLGLAGSVIEGEAMRIGRVVGTMDFMAPEQIRSVDTVGPPADIYAIGCTLYFAITGEVPFPGGTRQEKARRQLGEQPRAIRQLEPRVSADFCRVVEAMMQKDPGARPPSAQAVIELLKPWTPPSPLPMPRVKPGRSSKLGGKNAVNNDGAHAHRKATSSPASSGTGQESSLHESSLPDSSLHDSSLPDSSLPDSSRGANPSTRGLLSESEETDRAGELQPEGEPLPTEAGWGWLLVRSVVVAAVTALGAVALVRMVAFDEQQTGGMLGGGALQVIGWATFGLLMAIQLILAAGQDRE
jgi:eukaryotic-like serine/threonine-protein kinase